MTGSAVGSSCIRAEQLRLRMTLGACSFQAGPPLAQPPSAFKEDCVTGGFVDISMNDPDSISNGN